MSRAYDAIVVGGGIVGCACAYYLSFDLPRILVIEPGPIGGGTTAAGMGHVVVMDDSEAQFALTHYSQELWKALDSELPKSAESTPSGTLWVAADEEEAGFLPGKQAYYASRGVQAEVLSAAETAKAEPNLRPGLAGGLRVPNDGVIYPMPAARWLLDRAVERGADLWQGKAVRRMSGGSVVLEDGTLMEAGLTVNAAGSHAPELTPGLSIEPRKGHLVITDRYPGFVHHQIVEMGYLKSAHSTQTDSVAFNVQPRATGQLLIGSSRQFVGWDSHVDRAIVGRMMRRALEFMPNLARLSAIRTWTGFRAATPDKLPLIGPWAAEPGLYVAAGHEGLGITTSLATGRILADLIAGRRPEIDPTPFACVREAHA